MTTSTAALAPLLEPESQRFDAPARRVLAYVCCADGRPPYAAWLEETGGVLRVTELRSAQIVGELTRHDELGARALYVDEREGATRMFLVSWDRATAIDERSTYRPSLA
jgi:hypothetical protein